MRKITVIFLLTGCLLWTTPVLAEDLLLRNRPDTGIAMIRFPQSITVVQVIRDTGGIGKGLLKLWFRKMDPARLVPVKIAKNVKGEVGRDLLNNLGSQYGTDLLLAFRTSRVGVNLITQGLVYFVKQKKAHPLITITVENLSTPDEPDKPVRATLKQLVVQTRKIIHSYKFEKRQSNY